MKKTFSLEIILVYGVVILIWIRGNGDLLAVGKQIKRDIAPEKQAKKAKIASMRMNLENAKLPASLEVNGKDNDETNGQSKIKGYDPSEKSRLYGDGKADVMLDPEKMKAALGRAKNQQNEELNGIGKSRKNKKKYNSFENDGKDVTAEDMEVYRMKKVKTSDPMSELMGKGDDYVAPLNDQT
mmetsp:Transcript_17925/g.22861  ORF Transcript_17925/g.22861 Transcript_17925/m.22861 type:complete len:183 (+) Transcript_17925:1714-2262(+)